MRDDTEGAAQIYVRDFGSGPNKALLLHCALAHSKIWTAVAVELSDHLTMVAPDMPGHGRSAPWGQSSDLHDFVTSVALENLGSGGHVIGHSFGATVALRLAMEEPEKVHSLTLIEPVLFAAAGESDPAVLQAYIDAGQSFSAALQQGAWITAAADFIAKWGGGRDWSQLGEKEQALFASQMPFIHETEPCLLYDANGLLTPGRMEAIRCPTRLIRGADSEPVIAAIHATLARRIPNAQDVVIPKASHMLPVTHPTLVADQIRSLLKIAAA